MANAPCKDCPDRIVGCHSTCNKYKQYRVEQDAQNKAIREQNERQVVLSKGSWTGDSYFRRGRHRKR